MILLLLIYLFFLLAYLIFNGYIIFRINTMRIKGDLTTRGIIVYLIVMVSIIVISIFFISTLKWNLSFHFGGGNLAI